MSIKNLTIRELENLDPADLLRVHELIQLLKQTSRVSAPLSGPHPFEKVQELLAGCPGSLAEDIHRDREERG